MRLSRPDRRAPLAGLALLASAAIGVLAATGGADDEPPAAAEDEAPARPEPVLLGPRTGPERVKALQRGGGNAATERAVDRALDWLARHARPEGGWDADGFPERCEEGAEACDGVGKGHHGEDIPCPFDGALTGFATLAFLGRGHLPSAADEDGDPRPGKDGEKADGASADVGPDYSALVAAALGRLRGARDTWTLPLAVQAFAEAEAMEGRGRWLDEVQSGVDALMSRRQDDGAWGYIAGSFRPGSDVPYTTLVVQALTAARDAGAVVPDDVAEGVGRWLDTLERDKKGRLAYLVDGRRYGYTPTSCNAHCAAAVRRLLDVGTRSRAHAANLRLISKQRPVWKISFRMHDVPGRGKVPVQIGNLSMYQWWYGTIATFHEGGGAWSSWFGKAKSALVGHQEKSGCARGSWDPEGTYERSTGGRLFATAMGALILEQPYRQRRRER